MTRRREVIVAAAGLAALVAAAFIIRVERLPVTNRVLSDRCATPVSVIEPDPAIARAIFLTPRNEPLPSAIVIHGLSGNRRIMYSIGQSLAQTGLRTFLLDSPGEGDSTGQFSYAAAESCAMQAVRSLENSGEISMPRTLLIGHSLGGAIAVRLADDFPDAAGTIAISPAPLTPPRHAPADLLVLSAQFDPPQLVRAARALITDMHGLREAPTDFAQRRAVGFQSFSLAMHTSVLNDPRVETALTMWTLRSLEAIPVQFNATREVVALLAIVIGAIGIAAMVPFVATSSCALLGAKPSAISVAAVQPVRGSRAIGTSAAAAIVTAGLLLLGVPLRALHLYSADYLASFISLTGLLLLAALPREFRGAFRGSIRAQAAAIVFGICVCAAFAAWFNWQFADLWPNAPRWLLILPLAAVIWPYFAAEELALGALTARSGQARWLLFGAMRLALLTALVLAYFGFGNREFLPVLISPALGLVSVCQRAASDALQRRTRSFAAAATLDAILAAWFLAAVFPLR
jgi:pimeloyl-ACP methyl ester carboxylesterase